MSTLFFDGFDRGTILKRLDNNYWSTQLRNYPQYAFGSFSYDHEAVIGSTSQYVKIYTSYSPNNGTLPINGYYSYGNQYQPSVTVDYPAFGQPPGFLALTNIPINESSFNLTPLSYLALSGFPDISGTKSYFGIRYLGIETKDINYYESDTLIEGRFGAKHPLLAFCSGNTTGLILNIVRATGDGLLNLRQEGDTEQNPTGPKISIGLEVEQNNATSGIFDLNIGDTVSQYRITPIYCGDIYGGKLIPSDNDYKILTIADTDMGGYYSNVLSRWVHFEIEIDHTGNGIRLKLEGADALVIDTDEPDRDLWDITIPISGFHYDNVRIFNRTYNSSMLSSCTGYLVEGSSYFYPPDDYGKAYYALGELMLIDDVTLIDNTGTGPTYFLGKDSKVLPLNPGVGFSSIELLTDDENNEDGPLQWSKSINKSNRAILASFDNDTSHLYTADTNKMSVVAYSTDYYNAFSGKDTLSNWRYSYNDGIGGMKVYNHARKEFLDTTIRNVVARTGGVDPYIENTVFLFHNNEIDPVIDYSIFSHPIYNVGNVSLTEHGQFDGALSFADGALSLTNQSTYDIGSGDFTIEAWVKFNTNNDCLVLFDRQYRSNLSSYVLDGTKNVSQNGASPILGYRFSATTGHAILETWSLYYDSQFFNPYECSTPATLKLNLPAAIVVDEWNHLTITRKRLSPTSISGYFNVFLNGVSGTGYAVENLCDGLGFNFCEGNCPSTFVAQSSNEPFVYALVPDDSQGGYYDVSGLHFGVLTANYRLSNNTVKPLPYTYFGGSGLLDEHRVISGLCLYNENFTPEITPYIGPSEQYIEFGPNIDLTRTSYRMFQYYQMNHPESLEPFTSGQIINSGLKLGIKKL